MEKYTKEIRKEIQNDIDRREKEIAECEKKRAEIEDHLSRLNRERNQLKQLHKSFCKVFDETINNNSISANNY